MDGAFMAEVEYNYQKELLAMVDTPTSDGLCCFV
jgi:hypothetical protein